MRMMCKRNFKKVKVDDGLSRNKDNLIEFFIIRVVYLKKFVFSVESTRR